MTEEINIVMLTLFILAVGFVLGAYIVELTTEDTDDEQ